MPPRVAPIVSAAFALIAVAACGASPGPSAVTPTPAASAKPSPSVRPVPTPVATPIVSPSPAEGNVDGGDAAPELGIEPVEADTIRATIADPAAKAWRLVVSGVGERAGDRWEVTVETGDVGPAITATEIRAGRVVGETDLAPFANGTAVVGVCHRTLPVCLSPDGFRLPRDGDGRFSVELVLPEPGTPLAVTGGTATWPGEPFVPGPWTDTESFPWNPAG